MAGAFVAIIAGVIAAFRAIAEEAIGHVVMIPAMVPGTWFATSA